MNDNLRDLKTYTINRKNVFLIWVCTIWMIVAYTHCLRQKLLPLADLQSFIILQSTDGKMNLRKNTLSWECRRQHSEQYLKIEEKVSFYNIAGVASYVFILGTKVSLKSQNGQLRSQTMLPDSSILIGQKLVKNAKIQMRHFGW